MRFDWYTCTLECFDENNAVLWTDALIIHALEEKDWRCMRGDVILPGEIILEMIKGRAGVTVEEVVVRTGRGEL